MQDSFFRHTKDFEEWKASGFPGILNETRDLIEYLFDNRRKNKLWNHQMESFVRTVYWYEVLNKKNCLLNIVTGGGKTVVIAAVIFWLKSVHKVSKFLILTPNLIVRDRLEFDFANCKIFKDFEFCTENDQTILNELGLHVLERGQQPQGMLESGIVLGNIQQFYTSHITGRRNLSYLMKNIGDLAVFNDEAHNTPALEYSNVLNLISQKCLFRLDTTATPNRADGQEPDSEMIYYYDITKALEDGIIKSIVVYEPEVKLLKLTYTNFETGEKRDVTELDAEFKEAEKQVKPFQWILNPEPMKKQISIALQRLTEQRARAGGKYKPILFVITMSINEGKIAQQMLQEQFKINTLLVTEESDEFDRKIALDIGKQENKYEAVVSVLMLREGWDVPQVSTILLLRKFSSPVYGQQVIGRGLRRILRDKPEPEILSVVDHPRLEHDWLWRLVAVSKIRQNVTDEDQFDIEEDLPLKPLIQSLVRPEKIIKIPEPQYEVKINFQKVKDDIPDDTVETDWQAILDAVTYDREAWMITKTRIETVRSQRLKDKRLEIIDGPEDSIEFAIGEESSREELEAKLKNTILDITAGLLREAGFGGLMKGKLYSTIMDHISKKIFGGKSLADSEKSDIEYAMYISTEIRRNFTKPIVAGILSETHG
jgi:type III restriction enzyme